MNRHHFAVYIRHCKLEMLMRRESDAEAAFRAAEWRWNLQEVCDSQWHTYSILFASVDQVNCLMLMLYVIDLMIFLIEYAQKTFSLYIFSLT